jgi:aerobic C4-dicarboxylate transport protein
MAKMGNIKEVGRIGVIALLYFEIMSTLALSAGATVPLSGNTLAAGS